MKPQLLIVTGIFNLGSSWYKSVMRMQIWLLSFDHVAHVHAPLNVSVFNGLQQKIINSNRISLIIH